MLPIGQYCAAGPNFVKDKTKGLEIVDNFLSNKCLPIFPATFFIKKREGTVEHRLGASHLHACFLYTIILH